MNKSLVRGLVGLFVVVDAALVVGMYRHVHKTPATVDLPAAASTPSASASVPAAGDQTSYTFKAAKAKEVSLANDGSTLVGTRGQCDGTAGTLTLDTSGAREPTTLTPGLDEILAVDHGSASDLTVVGATSSCDVKQVTSSDGGKTWTDAGAITLWYPNPKVGTKVVSPSRTSDAGCTVTSLSQVGDDFARVTCTDGKLRGTGDGGKTWVALGTLANIRVATFSTFNSGYALARYQGCAAQEFTTNDGGRSWSTGGCITGDPAQAIASSDVAIAAVVENQMYLSTDQGKTFTQP